ncbi:hypothetical protein [Kineococcus rubinsiae]|uniref:hypothetical protein n=1 Tax=Kineococcus rubinsiae TaxID=2609562 RepID=UPI00142FEC71|nr:hypothetical protein [Kineococcus rubinsiae]NIZ92696.1 hypothetical protein [Kineococcus rubinsiae]
MLWALVWTVLGLAALAVLGLLVRRDVKAALALLRELAAASEQLARVSAATGRDDSTGPVDGSGPTGRPVTSEAPGVHLPAALGGLRAAEAELRRWLDWPIGARDARGPGDGRTMLEQRPPLEV